MSRALSCSPHAPGVQVYEDSPQEMRSRLWYVLLNRPHLIEPLQPVSGPEGLCALTLSAGNSPQRLSPRPAEPAAPAAMAVPAPVQAPRQPRAARSTNTAAVAARARRRASIIISEEAAAAAAAADASFKAAQVAEQQKLLHKAAAPRRTSSSNGSMSLPLPMLRKRSSSATDNYERSGSSSEQAASDSMAGLMVVGSAASSIAMQPLPTASDAPSAPAGGWSDNLLAGGDEPSAAPPAPWDNISLEQPSPSDMPAQSAPLPHLGMPLDLSSTGMPTSTPPGSTMPPGGSGSSTPNKRGGPSRRNTGSMPGTPGRAVNGSSGGAGGEEGWELVTERGLPAAAAATVLPSDTLTRVQSIMDSLVAEAVSGWGAACLLRCTCQGSAHWHAAPSTPAGGVMPAGNVDDKP